MRVTRETQQRNEQTAKERPEETQHKGESGHGEARNETARTVADVVIGDLAREADRPRVLVHQRQNPVSIAERHGMNYENTAAKTEAEG